MSVSRRKFLSQAGVGAVTAAVALSQTGVTASAAAQASSTGLGCALPDAVEPTVQATIAAVSDLHTKSPQLPGFVSFDRFFAASYPDWLSEDDSTLLLGALYLKALDVARVSIEVPSTDATCQQLGYELPTALLGPDYFKQLLAHAQKQVAANPDARAVYEAAAARALALTGSDGLAVYAIDPKKIRRAAYVVGVAVGAFVRGFIDGFFG